MSVPVGSGAIDLGTGWFGVALCRSCKHRTLYDGTTAKSGEDTRSYAQIECSHCHKAVKVSFEHLPEDVRVRIVGEWKRTE